MIDEKKLIEEIENTGFFIAGLRSGKEMLRKYLTEYRKAIVKIINNQPRVDNWIPCIKKLPDGCSDAEIEVIVSIHEPYLETVIDDSGFALYYPGTNKFHSAYGDRLDITDYVVAWQPLPTPYNEKRGGKNA